MTRLSPRLTAVAIAAARGIVGVVLLTHPREFRRRFGGDVLNDVAEDVRRGGTEGLLPCARAAVNAVADAIAGIRSNRATSSFDLQEGHMHRRTWLRGVWSDLRVSVRGLRRERAFSASIILLLALGIGLNAAMFGVVDRLLLKGADHVRDAERVRRLQIAFQPAGRDVQRNGGFGYSTFKALRAARSFEALAAYDVTENGAILGRGLEARRINRGDATAGLFTLLGVTPALGRFYTEGEDDPFAPQRVVVLGHGLWQLDFGGRTDVIGQSITIDNATYSIVGVAPKAFTGPDLLRVDAWMPLSLTGRTRASNWTDNWNSWWLSLVVRLQPDASPEQADAEATALFQAAFAGTEKVRAKASVSVQPLFYTRDGIESMELRVSTWLWVVAGIVLLVACANVVNLVLAHQIRRRREVAVRLALGASRGRIIRLLVTEALTLALAGGAAGLAVAYGVGTFMRAWLIPGVEWSRGPMDVRVLAVSLLVSLASGLMVGLLPSWRATAPKLVAFLKTGVREGGGRRQRTRATLTMMQAAFSALLLVGSGLFVTSLERIRAMDLGLQPDRVLTLTVQRSGIPAATDPLERQRERDRRAAFYPGCSSSSASVRTSRPRAWRSASPSPLDSATTFACRAARPSPSSKAADRS